MEFTIVLKFIVNFIVYFYHIKLEIMQSGHFRLSYCIKELD